MIADYAKIVSILQKLDLEYSSCVGGADIEKPIIISKIAVLELCGWIEESVDLILLDYINHRISDQECIKYVEEVIRKNNGFKYKENLFHLFTVVLGLSNWENVVDALTYSRTSVLEAVCNNYTKLRNVAAHTYRLTGITVTYFAPSQVIADYHKIEPIFKIIETEIKKYV